MTSAPTWLPRVAGWAAQCALVAAATLSSSAWAGGTFDTWAPDARSLALGGARTSTGGGAAAAHYNPAALSFTNDPELAVSFVLSEPGLFLETERTGPDGSLSPALPPAYGGYSVGFLFPFTGWLEDWVTFGIQVYFPATVLTHYRAYDPARPFFYMYDTATDHYESALALSLSPFEWLSLGGGLRYSAGQRGVLDVTVDPLRQRITEQVFDAWQFSVVAPTVGVTFGPIGTSWLEVQGGASWWEPLVQPVQLPARIGFDGLDAGVFAPIDGVSNFTPRTISGGVTTTFRPGALVRLWGDTPTGPLLALGSISASLDVGYQFWSEAPPPFLGLAVSATGTDLNLLGLGNALNAPALGEDRVRPVGFVDTARVRASLEWTFLHDLLSLRAGYGFRPSPVPDQTSGTNIVDTAVHAVSAGAGVEFGIPPLIDGKVRVDAGWQTHILAPRSVNKINDDDPVGDWTASGFVHAASLMTTYEF